MILSLSQCHYTLISFFFFFNDTATTEIYTLSLHDALPICQPADGRRGAAGQPGFAAHAAQPLGWRGLQLRARGRFARSEEHTSELQSPCNLVCRLLLEKKKKTAHDYKSVHITSTQVCSMLLTTTA